MSGIFCGVAPLTASHELLSYVLREGRFLTGETPEQVGDALDLSGRTIRRLEDSSVRSPRAMTLEALAGYYALNASFLRWLADLDADGASVRDALKEWAAEVDVEATAENPQLAMLLARTGVGRRRPRDLAVEGSELVAHLMALDRRRRALVSALVDELLMAQSEDVRRRS